MNLDEFFVFCVFTLICLVKDMFLLSEDVNETFIPDLPGLMSRLMDEPCKTECS